MRARLLICTLDGQPVIGLDGAHGDVHALRVIEDNLALLEQQGVPDCFVVEYDPTIGGDDANDHVRHLHCLKVELHERPDGRREVVDVLRCEDDTLRGGRSICGALRILHGPDVIANRRTVIHRRARGPSP